MTQETTERHKVKKNVCHDSLIKNHENDDEPRRLSKHEIEMIRKKCIMNAGSFKTYAHTLYYQETLKNILKPLVEQLSVVQLRPSCFDEFCETIVRSFRESMIEAGEMVGITCAQSIGERQTQMSVSYDTPVWVRRREEDDIFIGHIGEFIDSFFETETENIQDMGYEILSVSAHGKVGWRRLTDCTRHPPNGSLVEMITTRGRRVITTLTHSLLTTSQTDIDQQTITKSSVVFPIEARHVKKNYHPVPVICGRDYDDHDDKTITRECRAECGVDLVKECLAKISRGEETESSTLQRTILSMTHNQKDVKEIEDIFESLMCESTTTTVCLRPSTREEWYFLEMVCRIYIDGVATSPFTYVWRQNRLCFSRKTESSVKTDMSECWETITHMSMLHESEYPYTYVYDFSVEDNETFMILNGLFVHNTLNTFHSAGLAVQTVLTGVPRFLELLNTTKEPKFSSCSFSVTRKVTSIDMIRDILTYKLVSLTVGDLVERYDVFTADKPDELWYESFEDIYQISSREWSSHPGIRLCFDQSKLYHYRIQLNELSDCIEHMCENVYCLFSPQHLGQIDVFMDQYDTPTHMIEKHKIPSLFSLVVCGLPRIRDYVVQIKKKNSEPEYTIVTQGSNMKKIMGQEWVNKTTVCSNNMWEVYHTLGIEAVRQFLLDEFKNVITSDGTFIHPSHTMLLVDIMTYHGHIMSISRYGMKKEQSSPLVKASFEECLDHFLTAGFLGEREDIKGVSASIICGRRSKIGTGLSHLVFDTSVFEDQKMI